MPKNGAAKVGSAFVGVTSAPPASGNFTLQDLFDADETAASSLRQAKADDARAASIEAALVEQFGPVILASDCPDMPGMPPGAIGVCVKERKSPKGILRPKNGK